MLVSLPVTSFAHAVDVFGIEAISQPDGFLISGKTDGNLRVVDVTDWDDAITHIITDDPDNDWFYHRALWKDMDGDGLKDAVTCRAYQDFTTGTFIPYHIDSCVAGTF